MRRALIVLTVAVSAPPVLLAQTPLPEKHRQRDDAKSAKVAPFPKDLVEFKPVRAEPVFRGQGAGHWDAAIRERGWILKENTGYRMWYTGYDGTGTGVKRLGYASSKDGLHWVRHPRPLIDDLWIEDMMVVKHGRRYFMFAEGYRDRAHLLTSADGMKWKPMGKLDVRQTNGRPISEGAYGTPTAWHANKTWYLLYERRDEGIWLATSKDLKTWTNRSDKPVLRPGPGAYDRLMIAANQIVRRGEWYYVYYHGTGTPTKPRQWCTCIAASRDLLHWTKYPNNPLQPVAQNKSSGIIVPEGDHNRLYTMHDSVVVHASPRTKVSADNDAKNSAR